MNDHAAETPGFVLATRCERRRGRPILFVHGLSHNGAVWRSVADELDVALRPIALDLRGHGDSPWSPEGAYDLHHYAADLAPTLDDLGIEQVDLVAHSLGGNVATLFAAHSPGRVASLVLVDTGPALAGVAMDRVTHDVAGSLSAYPSTTRYADWLRVLHPLAAGDALQHLAEESLVRRLDENFELKLDPGIVGSAPDPEFWPRTERLLWEALRRVACPCLVVRGGRSALLPEKVAHQMVEEVLEAGRLVTLERAGHAVMLDDPDGLRLAIEAFLGETRGAATVMRPETIGP